MGEKRQNNTLQIYTLPHLIEVMEFTTSKEAWKKVLDETIHMH